MKWDECLRWFRCGSAIGPNLGNEDKTLGDIALVANHVSKRKRSSLPPSALPSVKCLWPKLNRSYSLPMCGIWPPHGLSKNSCANYFAIWLRTAALVLQIRSRTGLSNRILHLSGPSCPSPSSSRLSSDSNDTCLA